MATHSYRIQAISKDSKDVFPRKTSLLFHRVMQGADNLEGFLGHKNSSWYEEEYCRESVSYRFRETAGKFKFPTSNTIFGIRCYGEQYTTVVKEITKTKPDKKAVLETIAKVLSESFELNISLDYGSTDADAMPGEYRFTYLDLRGREHTKSCNRTVTVYIKTWENKEVTLLNPKVSGVLAVLREPLIISRIVSGKITDKESLIDAISRIALARLTGKIAGYYCMNLACCDYEEIDIVLREITSELKSIHNDDGSDWYSMLHLGIFLFSLDKESEEESSSTVENCSGPVDYAEDKLSDSTKRKFLSRYVPKSYNDEISNIVRRQYDPTIRNLASLL